MADVFLAKIMIDSTGKEPIQDGGVIVEGGRITAAGPISLLSYDTRVDHVIDLGNSTLMPGMIDSHCHIFLTAGITMKTEAHLWGPEEWVSVVADGLKGARLWLNQGVTTVRDVGSAMNLDLGLRDLIAQKKVIGPCIFGSGRTIAMAGRHSLSGHGVSSAEEARRAAREQLHAGANLIKLFASAGVGGGYGKMIGETGWEQLTVEEMQAAVYETHKAGRTATAHAQHPQSIKNAIIAGVDSIEHGTYVDEEGIDMMKEHDVVMIPTLFVAEVLTHGTRYGFGPQMEANARIAVEKGYESVRMAHAAGVRIAAGTDPNHLEESMARECASLLKAGLSPMEVIVAATRTGAELLKVQDRLGTLEPGKIADLIVIDGNPLEDLSALERVQWVVKEGQIFFSPENGKQS